MQITLLYYKLLQSQLSDNDGIEDCLVPSSSNDLASVTCQQFKLIFQIMSSFLSWLVL